jgi:hypothetical protein
MTVGTPANYTGAGQGSSEFPADTYAPNGQTPQDVGLPIQAFGLGVWTTYTAAGTSQGTATAMTGYKNLVTVALTASTKGVKLPAAATGLTVVVGNAATFGVKVYAAAGNTIAAGTTATTADPTVLAINKVNAYYASSGTKWIVFRGA